MVNKRFCVICREIKSHFFATFPLDETRCRKWVQLTGNLDLVDVPIEKLHTIRYVCGIHFTKEDFAIRRLKRTVVPSLHLYAKPLTEEQMRGFPYHLRSYYHHPIVWKMAIAISQQRKSRYIIGYTKKLVPVDRNMLSKSIKRDHNYFKDEEKETPRPTVLRRQHKYQKTSVDQQHVPGACADTEVDPEPIEAIEQDDESEQNQHDSGETENDMQSTVSEPDEPDIELNMCRICLQSFSKLMSIDGLRTAYKDLTGVTVDDDDGLPQELCYECGTLLDKYHKFRDKAIKGDLLLRQIYDKDNDSQTSKPLDEIEEQINSLASTIDYSSELITIDIEPTVMIEVACQCNMDKEINEQCMQDLEMSVVDDEESNIMEIDVRQDIDTQMIDYDSSDQAVSTKDYAIVYSSDNDTNSSMANETDLYMATVNRNQNESNVEIIIEDDSQIETNQEVILEDAISVKEEEEEDELSDPLNSAEITIAQDHNLIEINYDITKLSFKEQMQQHGKRENSPRYLSSAYKCRTCFEGFGSRACYETHMDMLHSLDHTERICMICNARYSKNQDLVTHITNIHLFKYQCKNCQKILHNRKSALRHITTHSGTIIS